MGHQGEGCGRARRCLPDCVVRDQGPDGDDRHLDLQGEEVGVRRQRVALETVLMNVCCCGCPVFFPGRILASLASDAESVSAFLISMSISRLPVRVKNHPSRTE